MLATFHERCFSSRGASGGGGGGPPRPPPTRALIAANLADPQARHLMVITRQGAALKLLFGCGLLRRDRCDVLVASQFAGDASELALIQQINAVKRAMGAGRVVVLVNHDHIYESLCVVRHYHYYTLLLTTTTTD